MSNLDQRLLEYRVMRDASKANLIADLEHVKYSFSGKSIAGRFVDRISDGARDVFDQASETAEDNRGIIAALIGAIVLWLSRGPLLEMLGIDADGDDAEDKPETQPPTPDPSGDDDERYD